MTCAKCSMAISDFVQKNPEPSVGPMADRAHHGTISAAPQEVAVAAQLQGWMLAWGIRGACWSHDQLLVEPADEREQKKPTPPRGLVSAPSCELKACRPTTCSAWASGHFSAQTARRRFFCSLSG